MTPADDAVEIFGSPVSNCYNAVLASLYHKGITPVEHHIGASMAPDFLRRSPMGKIPYLYHRGEYLSETLAIVEYLDECFAGKDLLPGTALERARRRQLTKFVELYLESPSRRLFPGVFWAGKNDAVHVDEVRPVLERGLQASEILLGQCSSLLDSPCGAAEYYSFFSLALVNRVTQHQYGWDLLAKAPLLKRFADKALAADFIAKICNQRDGAMQAYLEKKAAESGRK
ncbi:glutathione S-transferase family protein [Spongiibacter taiwanensis]|uniref:glutathione S-transferase family protein n=1 Tax=Spongiibacter taiwanensis TaxID=1748242 RepID=UPI00203551DA|nr:glutathione S-transferase family protein [Spongiibacter taiwanensis]USA42441.1 glutathione S-transferase family protein [Spongiibacter taiwanensis]